MVDYLYDGSFDGLLTCIFYAYKDKKASSIFREDAYHPSLLTTALSVPTEEDKATRVHDSIVKNLSFSTLSNVYYLYLSEYEDAETLALQYLRLCYKYTDKINLAKNNDIIRKVDLYTKRVGHEAHRFTGFVRFEEISPMVFYSKIEPDHFILPLLMEHFVKRFSDQYFIIHDLKRQVALVYNTKEAFLQSLSNEEQLKLLKAPNNDPFINLFKTYYKATTITERINIRRRNAFIPKRYFKHLGEL